MRHISAGVAFLLMFAVLGFAEPQIPAPASTNGVITLTTGTAIPLVPNPSSAPPLKCNSILIQAQPGNAAVVYILTAPVGVTMLRGSAGTTTVATLGIGSSTSPGNAITIPSNNPATAESGGVTMNLWGVQGTTNDTVTATCDLRN